MLIAITTGRTRPGSVGGINQHYRQTRTPRLVLNPLKQLKEAPVSKFKTHFSAKTVSSISNTTEVFKSKCLPELRRRFDKPATYIVVHPFGEPTLPSSELLKVALGGFRTTLLKSCTKPSHAAAKGSHFKPAVLISFAIRSNLNNAKVYAKESIDFTKRRVFNVADSHQVELPINKAKLRFSSLSFKKPCLIVATDKRDFLPSIDRPDAHHLLVKHIPEYSGIVSDSPMRAKRSLRELVEFVGIGDFGKEQNSDLCSQPRVPANAVIPKFLQIKTLEYLRGKRTFRDNVSRLISSLQSLVEIFALLLRGQELDLCDEFHYLHTVTTVTKSERQGKTKFKSQRGIPLCGSQFLPRLNAQRAPGASLEVSL